MPNHIRNTLHISGDKVSVQEFFDKNIVDDRLDFEVAVPIGEPDDWYNQRIHKWGTKWNAYECVVDRENEYVNFETAWACPYEWLIEVSYLHPKCTFTLEFWDEDLTYNLGVYEVNKGNILSSEVPEGGSLEACLLLQKMIGSSWITDYLDMCNDEDVEEFTESSYFDHMVYCLYTDDWTTDNIVELCPKAEEQIRNVLKQFTELGIN